jgi:hypothetical protein
VSEEVIATFFGGDETETLGIVEPLYSASCHVLIVLVITIKGDGPLPGAKIKTAG